MPRRYPRQPIPGVGVVVFRGDAVLLIRRRRPPRAKQWSLPGGAQELGETVFEAARREVLEETGIEIAVEGLIDVVDLIDRAADGGRVVYHYTLIEVRASWRSGRPVAGDDALDAAWVDLDHLDPLGLWDQTLRIIRLAQAQRLAAGHRSG
jgi:ADP-ribose pyrophosphatase YjhB (NUDIX family)